MMKPIKKPSPRPKKPIVSRESIEIIIFFRIKTAKSDPQAREPGKKGQGGNGVSGIKRYLHTFFTKNHQSHTKNTKTHPRTLVAILLISLVPPVLS